MQQISEVAEHSKINQESVSDLFTQITDTMNKLAGSSENLLDSVKTLIE